MADIYSYCGSAKRVNVGGFNCDYARRLPKKLIGGGKRFLVSDVVTAAAAKAAIVAATKLQSGDDSKLYPIHNLQNPQDKTPEPTKGKVGEGPERVLVEGKPMFEYDLEIGQAQYQRMRDLNGSILPWFTYDSAGRLWGVIDETGTYFQGAMAHFWIDRNTQDTTSTPNSARITLTYQDEIEYHKFARYIQVDLGPKEPYGLMDAILRVIGTPTSSIKLAVEGDTAEFGKKLNFAKKWQAEFTAYASAIVLKKGTTPIPVTSLAYDPALECLTVTPDATAWGALAPNDVVTIDTNTVVNLDSHSIVGLEGLATQYIKP